MDEGENNFQEDIGELQRPVIQKDNQKEEMEIRLGNRTGN